MNDKIAEFRALHVPGDPLILVNIWDAGSAKAVAGAGAKAIATGSFGVAGAQGRADGEDFPIEDVFENLGRILSVTDLPVTIDMESGYGADPAAVGVSVGRAKGAGAAGINMEDRLPGANELLAIPEAAARKFAGAPPYGRFAALVISSEDIEVARGQAQRLGAKAPVADGLAVYGPAPAPLAMLRGRHRFRLLLHAPRSFDLQGTIRDWVNSVEWSSKARLAIDIDPYSFV